MGYGELWLQMFHQSEAQELSEKPLVAACMYLFYENLVYGAYLLNVLRS